MKAHELSLREVSVSKGDTASIVDHTVVFDTIHVITNETIWREPDSLGRLYPLRTILRESGSQRITLTDRVEQCRDTIFIATSDSRISSTDTQSQSPTNHWIPWLIIAVMVLFAIIILLITIKK